MSSPAMTEEFDSFSRDVDADALRLSEYAQRVLPLSKPLPDEYFYASLCLCVLDTVFSINARYAAVERVVARYSTRYGTPRLRPSRDCLPPRGEQEGVSTLVERIGAYGPDRFASEIAENRCRTSPRSGILKAEAAMRFAQVLSANGIEHFQDMESLELMPCVEAEIRAIPGQTSCLSFTYFCMLAGDEQLVKADRHLIGFVSAALGWRVTENECGPLLRKATQILNMQLPNLRPRTLDYLAWSFQRAAAASSKSDRRNDGVSCTVV